jgi:hypothetical protein
MKYVLIPLLLFGLAAYAQLTAREKAIQNKGSIPGAPYFTTNISVTEITNNVTLTISNGCPIVIKQ